ncbi:MAG: aminopeptidase P family N-terminal domain-containing protein [Anaerolineae bacterium]
MTEVDALRLERLREKMKEGDLDALVCRLPENVVYLTDYWPHHGFSVAVLPKTGRPLLFLPEIEEEYANPNWAEITLFGWGLLKDGDLYDNYRRLLGQVHTELDLKGGRVGVEKSFEIVGPTYRAAEPVIPAAPWSALLDAVFVELPKWE